MRKKYSCILLHRTCKNETYVLYTCIQYVKTKIHTCILFQLQTMSQFKIQMYGRYKLNRKYTGALRKKYTYNAKLR